LKLSTSGCSLWTSAGGSVLSCLPSAGQGRCDEDRPPFNW
jgi:hypothetical protein